MPPPGVVVRPMPKQSALGVRARCVIWAQRISHRDGGGYLAAADGHQQVRPKAAHQAVRLLRADHG
eukprot:7854449-Alexandrium_andersonii.AAC.1